MLEIFGDIVIDDRQRSVRRHDVVVHLGELEFEAAQLLLKTPGGLTADQLFERLYAGDRDGGPLSGVRAVYVRVHQINTKLAPLGIRFQSHGGRHLPYQATFPARMKRRAAEGRVAVAGARTP